MADNRYSVDDILRELNDSKQKRNPASAPAPSAPPPREARRPSSVPVQPDEDDFWEMKNPAPRREAEQQRVPRGREQQPADVPTRRPLREPPAGAATSPRLGQTIPAPRNREEMGKLLGRFDDSKQDPLGNLDFLEREPDVAYGDTPVKSFVPDWDKPRDPPRRSSEPARQQQQGDSRDYREAPPPQQRGYREEQSPMPRATRPEQQQPRSFREDRAAQQQRPPYRDAPPPQGGRAYSGQSRLQQEDRRELYAAEGRRSMSDAARLITSGGFDDEPATYDTHQAQRRQRQPAPQEQAQYRGAPRQPQSMPPQTAQQLPTVPQQRQRPSMPIPQTTQQTPSIPQQRPQRNTPAPARNLLDEDIFGEASPVEPRIEVKSEPRPEAPPADKQPGAKRESNQQVAAQLSKMKVSLFIRVFVNLLAVVGVVYLALAGEYSFPLPEFIAGEENIGAFMWTAVAMVITSALVSGNTVGGGILALFKLRPSNDSYSALAVFACLIQGSYLAMQPQLMASYGDNLYLPMAALMLLFNTFGKLILLSRMGSSFLFASGKGEKHVADIMDNREFARRISGDIVGEEPKIAYFTDAVTVDGFLEQAFSESKAEDISKIVAPMTALAALVMALVSFLFSRDIFIAACVYTAALCITAPLAGVIASNLPLSITNGKLSRFGASLCGYDAVNRFADTNGVLLRCSQLFPKGSVFIQDIKVLDRRPIDQVITDAASVLGACDSNLSSIFRDMVQDVSILHQPENLEYYDDMGLSAWVNGRRVLIGNRALMMSYGVSIPGEEFERPYTVGNNEVLYLANSGEAAAMYVLSYKADKQMRRAMELLCDRDMAVCVYSTDPNLTPAKISSIYNFPKELLSVIPASMQAGSEKYMVTRGKVKAAAVHNGNPASYLRTILAAQSCSKCITLETAMILMSVIIGFAIVTFFAFTQQMETLTWITIAVYQFFWLLIELVIPLVKH